MSARFAELAWQQTPMGEISLRRRREPVLDVDVFEVKLGEEFLMSSLFTVAEIALTTLGLAAVEGENLRVMVGGLGLGYTAQAALEDPRVASVVVVEALDAVIDWHQRRLLPVVLMSDPRTTLVHDDFFDLMRRDPASAAPERYDAIIVDIDHSPRHLLNGSHADFYTAEGLRRVGGRLAPGGVFALWSDDPPDAAFEAVLAEVFGNSASHVVAFDNALTGGQSSNSVYVATALR
ncbi:spermidine synthase [Marisediminicola sp. UYEF4]|uniref:spermidine synthase n=1 Tax=Marisediminicola sp. UYEF4 TaxID=1756384 RepID=UPI00339A6894